MALISRAEKFCYASFETHLFVYVRKRALRFACSRSKIHLFVYPLFIGDTFFISLLFLAFFFVIIIIRRNFILSRRRIHWTLLRDSNQALRIIEKCLIYTQNCSIDISIFVTIVFKTHCPIKLNDEALGYKDII